jgi:HlyD family secretion protein
MWKFIGIAALMTILVVVAFSVEHSAPSPSITRLPSTTTEHAPAGRIYAVGRVEGLSERIDLQPPLSGRVEEVLVREGQDVEKGQVLLRLDNRHYAERVSLAMAELESAGAELQRIKNGPTRHELSEAAAMLDAKVAQLQHAQLTWLRISKLREADVVTEQKADDQRSAIARLKSEVAAATARLENLKAQPRADEVRIAAARVGAAEAEVHRMQTELDRTQLRSPIRGRILRVDVKLGEIAGPNSPESAISIADVSRFMVRAFVEELDAPRIQLGTVARVTADGLPGKTFDGRVVRLSPMMGPKRMFNDRPAERHDTKTREVWVELGDLSEGLIYGLRVDVFFEASAT